MVGNHSFTDGRHWFDVLVDICNAGNATEFLQCFDKNLTQPSKNIIQGVDYLEKFTFDAAFPSPPPCYPSSPLDDEASDWIEVRHRVLLFKKWREKRRRGDKEEGCSLMRVALETPA